MAGKTILITGATNGIGLTAAEALARMGHSIILHGRNHEKGRAALDTIRQGTNNPDLRFMQADLASLAEVRNLAAEVNRLPRLDVLINNAGSANFRRSVTKDGFETTFAVNHLAPFLLTNLLLDKLKTAGKARIVNVSSTAHRTGPLDFSDLMSAKDYRTMRTYGRSKLANILFTRSLAKRLAGTGVTANSLHPGVVRTGLGQNNSPVAKFLMGTIGALFMISPDEGAKTTVHLAVSPDVENVTGLYFDKCKPVTPAPYAEDDAAAERLWEESAKLVGL